jgi:hypothetical protein
MTDVAVAQLGHNLPPEDAPSQAEIIRERLTEENADLLRRKTELVAGLERVPAEIDDASATKAADFIKQLTATAKDADARRVAAKEPYLAGGRAIDGFFSPIKDGLLLVKKKVEDRLTIYQRAKAAEERRRREEAERLAREEAERAAKEAAERAAAMASEQDLDVAVEAERAANQARADALQRQKEAEAKAADLHRTRGDLGAVASLRTTWDFEVLDIHAIPLETIRPYLPIAAVEQAIRGYVKAGGRELPGVRIYERETTVVR